MLTKEQKKEVVKKTKEKFKENKLAVFCNFEGLSVEKQRELKKQLKDVGGEVFVIKKRLLERCLLEEKAEMPNFFGSVIVGLAKDEILPAKIFDKFPLEKKEKLEFIGGALNENGKLVFLPKEEIKEIAKLPSREELLAKLAGVLKAPIANFNFVLKANIQKLTYILSNIQN